METSRLDILSKEELESIKGGGQWIYNTEDGKWYWMEGYDLDDPN